MQNRTCLISASRIEVAILLLVSVLPWNVGVRGAPVVSGELKQWHKVTLTLDGPSARETDNAPNPFTDYRMTVTFRHESGRPS